MELTIKHTYDTFGKTHTYDTFGLESRQPSAALQCEQLLEKCGKSEAVELNIHCYLFLGGKLDAGFSSHLYSVEYLRSILAV